MTFTPATARAALADPMTPAADIAAIATDFPDLRVDVAAHPNTYPALLQWLADLGDPAVTAAIASRSSAGSQLPAVASPIQAYSDPVRQPTAPESVEVFNAPTTPAVADPYAAQSPAASAYPQAAQNPYLPHVASPGAPGAAQYAPNPYAQPGAPMGYTQQNVSFMMPPVQQSNGVATAALILGIVAFFFAVIPFIGIFIAAPCGLLAFILGIVGAVKGNSIKKGLGPAIAAIVISIVVSIMMALGGGWIW